MTTHNGTVLAAHLGTARLAESLTVAIDPACRDNPHCPGNLQWVDNGDGTISPAWPGRPQPERWPELAAQLIESYPTNPKGATMKESDPAAGVARLAAETEGALVLHYCDKCEDMVTATTPDCGHADYALTGPYYYFPPAKPAPPTSRETLAANVKRLREAKGWHPFDLAKEFDKAYGTSTTQAGYIDGIECGDDTVGFAELDALAKALDTTPAALLTPETTT